MTRERALELADRVTGNNLSFRGDMAVAILAAVAEEQAGMVTHETVKSFIYTAVTVEREACAKIADSNGSCAMVGHPEDCEWAVSSHTVAGQIRERGILLKEGA